MNYKHGLLLIILYPVVYNCEKHHVDICRNRAAVIKRIRPTTVDLFITDQTPLMGILSGKTTKALLLNDHF